MMPANPTTTFLLDFVCPRLSSAFSSQDYRAHVAQYAQRNKAVRPVIYWMLREQRIEHNKALVLAQQIALATNSPLLIACFFRADLSKARMLQRSFDFLLGGLQAAEQRAAHYKIPLHFVQHNPTTAVGTFAKKHNAHLVVTDLFPLEPYFSWQKSARQALASFGAKLLVVDGHNSVPVHKASDKQEYAARTIRPKINRLLATYHKPFGSLQTHAPNKNLPPSMQAHNDWQQIHAATRTTKLELAPQTQQLIEHIQHATNYQPPQAADARAQLDAFVHTKLPTYHEDRNDPARAGTSQLSCFFHFGHLSCNEVIDAVHAARVPLASSEAFLEEFIIRKELSDNFCYYRLFDANATHPSETASAHGAETSISANTIAPAFYNNIPDWAQNTLKTHQNDPREYLYSYAQLLNAQTDDPAWNAAQLQLLATGYMHGYMRMYWAKKILQWSRDPAQAYAHAVALNDLLQLDGRDPNGYVGILWSLGGVHDRGWTERPIFGKIRYMNYNGLKRKFAIDRYISTYSAQRAPEETRQLTL